MGLLELFTTVSAIPIPNSVCNTSVFNTTLVFEGGLAYLPCLPDSGILKTESSVPSPITWSQVTNGYHTSVSFKYPGKCRVGVITTELSFLDIPSSQDREAMAPGSPMVHIVDSGYEIQHRYQIPGKQKGSLVFPPVEVCDGNVVEYKYSDPISIRIPVPRESIGRGVMAITAAFPLAMCLINILLC